MRSNATSFAAMFVTLGMTSSSWGQTYVVTSEDEVTYVEDPTAGTPPPLQIDPSGIAAGSMMVAWPLAEAGTGGIVDLVVFTNPHGGKYEVSLKWTTYSDTALIEGHWEIKKNNVVLESFVSGSLYNLDRFVGQPVDLYLDGGWRFEATISHIAAGYLDPQEVSFQVSDATTWPPTPLDGKNCRFRPLSGSPTSGRTDSTGTCIFNVKFEDMQFMWARLDGRPLGQLEGYVFVNGMPKESLTVQICVAVNNCIGAPVSTNSLGYYTLPDSTGGRRYLSFFP